MGKIFENPDWPQCLYWEFDPTKGWGTFNLELDQVTSHANDTKTPLMVIFQPLGDVPKGNPIPHMRRIVQLAKTHPNIIKMIIIMKSDWVIGKVFANMLNKVLSLEPEVKLVFSVDEARAVYQTVMENLAD